MTTTPRKLSSRYELGEILGFGGMSEVHMARDLRLSRDVAIKVLRADLARDPTFYLRFRREAQNAAALNHPAIVAVYDTGEAETDAGPLPFIVMEYVEGDTLRDIVRNEGPMAPRRAMEIIADVCAALDFSHRNGIVHRDMKPANIMLNRAGAVKVMDFGIARAIADSSSPMTQTAAVIGTAQYLSPEQARGEQVDARSDVYSVGCVLFEILTAEPPFKGDSPVAVAYQHVREEPPLPSSVHKGVPRELDSVILKAMSKNPANRYQSAAEMRSDLIRVLGGQRPSAPTVMTEEDRTTILGAVDSTARRYRTEPPVKTTAAVELDDDEEPKKRPLLKIGALVAAAMIVVAMFTWVGFKGFDVFGTGNDQIEVPDVTNLVAQEAQKQLEDLSFEVDRVDEFNDDGVAAGKVIATSPLAGSPKDKGSTVTLKVSRGPELIAVPRLSGLSQDQATQALNAARLRLDPTVERGPSSVAEKGKVIEQKPSEGSSIKIDSLVKITIGDGPESVRIPTVVGTNIDAARPNLEGAGFVVEVEEVASSEPKGEVISTNPTGGGTAEKGSTVRVQVSQGDEIPMPNLTNQTVPEAISTLRTAGWIGAAEQLIQTAEPVLDQPRLGRVVTQSPAPGAPIAKNGTVTIGVGTVGIPR
ncbi:Stk1 family PASTA domain-containing Ser/Thr kinase [Antrihabitans spumae]|uniref:non-specific serine/threonine protein kinase n=1 Tax=Antrihabitans spumae TaxID=3373370 RepID=A0ABW7KAF0_9NOCA